LKILNLSFQDFAGVGYCLSHAINKLTDHQAVNIRSNSGYTRYPAIAEMRDYNSATCRQMVYDSDVLIFNTSVQPFFQAFNLDPSKLKDKKKLYYCHGTELRYMGKDLLSQADQILGDYQLLISTPDLFLYAPENAKWLPACRSFSEIRTRYGLCNQDTAALNSYIEGKKMVTFCHAPTSEEKKGSATFYRVITEVVKALPYVDYLTIRNQPWVGCLSLLRDVDVYFDQDPPFISSYGTLSVECSVFHIPVVTKITSEVTSIIKRETNLKSPFITFSTDDDLMAKAYMLAENPKLRRTFGNKMYRYCKMIHDEKPVVERFLKILDAMD